MKGFSHFISGVTAASFFPWAVEAAVQGNPLYFILGGAMGILPDTLDFKFYRFFYRHDIYIKPDPEKDDPQQIAEQIAAAVQRARAEEREIRLKLHTIRRGADYWQQYTVTFDAAAKTVEVTYGPVVNTGQVPVPGTQQADPPSGKAALRVNLVQTYEAVTTVDIFDGPSFSFIPDDQGRVVLHFLPWHRTWSHSVVSGLLLGGAGTIIWGWPAGLVMVAGFTAHVLEDQLGYMGSNLFWPFTRRRYAGLRRMHATDALPNFLTVWICILLTFWNLYRSMEQPLYTFNFLQLVLWGGLVPLGVFAALRFLVRPKAGISKPHDPGREESDALMS